MAEKPQIDFGETDLAVPSLGASREGRRPVVCAIAFHPELERVGDEIVVGAGSSWRLRVSRLDGDFAKPGAQGGASPLGVSQVSREPLEVSRDGSELVFIRHGRSTVMVDGETLDGERRIGGDALSAGIVVELGHSVVLLLHERASRSAPDGDDLGMLGGSDAMEHVREQIRRVADLKVPVLVRGETGTGKELVARALHRLSGRRGAFVGVNMGAVPESTAAAELFGHVKGAFTDAKTDGKGYFQAAEGGTLFLDEIGEAANDIQVKLLRALETYEILRVGSSLPVKVNVRIVAATDADIDQLIALGRFKAPLYHRLSQFNIALPPLRERRPDIPGLLLSFLRDAFEQTAQGHRWAAASHWLPGAVVARMLRHDWPGNVRQLKSFVHALAISNRGQAVFVLTPELDGQLDAGAGRTGPPPNTAGTRSEPRSEPPSETKAAGSGAVSDAAALDALRAHHWEVRPAARALGIAPNTLYQLIDRSPQLRRASALTADVIRETLKRNDGDQTLAADELRLSLRALRQRMRELGIGGA